MTDSWDDIEALLRELPEACAWGGTTVEEWIRELAWAYGHTRGAFQNERIAYYWSQLAYRMKFPGEPPHEWHEMYAYLTALERAITDDYRLTEGADDFDMSAAVSRMLSVLESI